MPRIAGNWKLAVNLRPWIARTLWSAAASLGIGLVSGLLAVVLKAAGDNAGAAAVRGVMLVAVTVFGLAVVSLVVLLAVTELLRSPDAPCDDASLPPNNSK